jgi:quinone-modifying oxidoreductase subunit QmoA
MSAALEAAEAGYDVWLASATRTSAVGSPSSKYFPKLCPPYCGLEINFRRMRQNPRIRFFTMAEVQGVTGQEGDFTAIIKLHPRYVNEKCTACGKCAEATTMEIANPFNFGMDKTKAAYLPHDMAFPCATSGPAWWARRGQAVMTLSLRRIELTGPQNMVLRSAPIVWATGWTPTTPKLDCSVSAISNVITTC